MNLPGDRVHHIEGGYGWLVLPWFGGWLIWFRGDRRGLDRGLRRMSRSFHNCRVTGVR